MILTITRLDEINALLVSPKNETVNEYLTTVDLLGWPPETNHDMWSGAGTAKKILTGLQKRHR
jgi:hypothetical protein